MYRNHLYTSVKITYTYTKVTLIKIFTYRPSILDVYKFIKTFLRFIKRKEKGNVSLNGVSRKFIHSIM